MRRHVTRVAAVACRSLVVVDHVCNQRVSSAPYGAPSKNDATSRASRMCVRKRSAIRDSSVVPRQCCPT